MVGNKLFETDVRNVLGELIKRILLFLYLHHHHYRGGQLLWMSLLTMCEKESAIFVIDRRRLCPPLLVVTFFCGRRLTTNRCLVHDQSSVKEVAEEVLGRHEWWTRSGERGRRRALDFLGHHDQRRVRRPAAVDLHFTGQRRHNHYKHGSCLDTN